MNVVKNNETVCLLPREYSWILWYFITRGGKIRVAVTGCRRLVVRVKQKLMAWKNFWRARFAGKHSKTPLGATTTEKRSMSYTKTLSVSFSAPSEELWILIRVLRTPITDVSMDKPHPRFLTSILRKKGLYMDVYGSYQITHSTQVFLQSMASIHLNKHGILFYAQLRRKDTFPWWCACVTDFTHQRHAIFKRLLGYFKFCCVLTFDWKI